jgi:hypothetical protein
MNKVTCDRVVFNMNFIKKATLAVLVIFGLYIMLIFFSNYWINTTAWKYGGGKDYRDWMEFDEKCQAKGCFIYCDGKIEKMILLYCGSNLVICDPDFSGLTDHVNKGSTKSNENGLK